MINADALRDAIDRLPVLNVPARKRIRSMVVLRHLFRGSDYPCPVLCFSCGHASAVLKKMFLTACPVLGQPQPTHFLDISPKGDLAPTAKYWSLDDIGFGFPGYFDATSGHLPTTAVQRLAEYYGDLYLAGLLPELDNSIPVLCLDGCTRVNCALVASGSGETVKALQQGVAPYSGVEYIPLFDCSTPPLTFHRQAPLVVGVCKQNWVAAYAGPWCEDYNIAGGVTWVERKKTWPGRP